MPSSKQGNKIKYHTLWVCFLEILNFRDNEMSRKPKEEPSVHSEEEASDYSEDEDDGEGDDEDDQEEEEVRYNILDREKRVTAGRRYQRPSAPVEAEKDAAFWGTTEHDTWVEEEDDSSVSYNSDDDEMLEDESISDSADIVDSSESDISEDAQVRRGTKKNKYVDPALAKPKVTRAAQPKTEKIAHPAAVVEKRVLRDRGSRLTETATTVQTVSAPVKMKIEENQMSQDEILAEARLTEEYNTQMLRDYYAFESATEKPVKSRDTLQPSIVSRSFIDDAGNPNYELLYKNGASPLSLAAPMELKPRLCAVTGHPAKYFDPVSGLPYLNSQAFKSIRNSLAQEEGKNFAKAVQLLQSRIT